jgi:hypothetical protein
MGATKKRVDALKTLSTQDLRRFPIRATGRLLGALLLPLAILVGLVHLAAAATEVAPVLDLNGPLQPGAGFTTTYTEDETPRLIVDGANLTISDTDSDTLTWAKVTLQQTPDGGQEMLSADPGSTGITVKYKPATGVLDLTGTRSLAEYQQVLRTVTYVNSSQAPDASDRSVLFEVNDGVSRSDVVTSTVTINAVNDAPLLDNSGTMQLVGINENVFDSLGNKVETIVASAGGDRITDPDDGALEGIAVIEVGLSNGAWQYSLDAGGSWLPFLNVSNQAAVLLGPLARVRFVPNPQFSGSATFTFRAWDQTMGNKGDIGVDVSKNGGTTAFSVATESATINVTAVNDAPVVDLNGPEAGFNFSAGYLGSGVPIPLADQDATISDPDSQTLTSATLRLTNRPDGALETLSINVGTKQITPIPYDPVTGILTLSGPESVEAYQDVLRTATYVNTAITPSGGPRVVEITVNDGQSDSAPVTTTIQINPNNTAPTLNAPGGLLLSTIPEDMPSAVGNKVGAMLAGGGDPITDPDAGALEGIALVGADNSRGAWQYATMSDAGGPLWQPVGVISDTAAILLNPEALLRFVPALNYAGPSGNLTFRAWDQTTGTNGQRNVNAAVNGGSTAFSTQTAVASLTVTPVNDEPVITYTGPSALVYQEDGPPLPLLSGSLVITDVDTVTLASATVTLVNRPNADAETLAVAAGSSGLTTQYSAGILLISGPAPIEAYRQVLSTLTYSNASQDPNEADRQVQVVVNDGLTGSAPLLRTVGVVAVNDPPIADLNGAGPGVDFSTTFYIQWRPARITDPNMALVDQDDTSLQKVTVRLVNSPDGAAESLTARVGSTNITPTYDPSTGVLLLSGMDSVTNYQQVLRTLTYNNVLANPTPALRTVEFQAEDATQAGPISRTTISIQPTPTANLFMPIIGRRSEEPNDVCREAPAAAVNRDEQYFADDRHDWFYFDLAKSARVVVRLKAFAPGEGQLIIARGSACGALDLVGSNGDNQTNKVVDLGRQEAGRYYIWIINDGAPNTTDPYTLRIDVTP